MQQIWFTKKHGYKKHVSYKIVYKKQLDYNKHGFNMLRTYWLGWKYSDQLDYFELGFNRHGYNQRLIPVKKTDQIIDLNNIFIYLVVRQNEL